MSDRGITPAALNAFLAGELKNFVAASTPGGIEAQEAQGQRDFVANSTLPVKMDTESRKVLEKAGVHFGEILPDDPLFQEVKLPSGWKKVPTDHSMWSDLVNDQGQKVASIFYKAAFYDRKASLRAVTAEDASE